VSRTALRNILEKPDVVPELETLEKLSLAFGMPLWRIVEMTGFDLDLPKSDSERTRRLAALLDTNPEFRPIVDHMLRLQPGDFDGILVYLEGLQLRRGRPGRGRLKDDSGGL
jgi:hypothetical protein